MGRLIIALLIGQTKFDSWPQPKYDLKITEGNELPLLWHLQTNGWALNWSSCGLISQHFIDLTPVECKRTTTRDMKILAADHYYCLNFSSHSCSSSLGTSKEVKKINNNNASSNQRFKVQATMTKDQNAFAPTLCFAQVSCDRWSKHAWSDYDIPYSFLVEVQMNAGYIHATHA